ncbi:MAG TPA: AI-2E family transporter [Candidatus Paceibacterota bacterium]|nr:AI-2E family transporter [Candidatus Paceibacterota bacterium]
MDHTHIRAYFLAILTTLLTVLAIYMLRPFLVTVGLAAVFAVIFLPLNRRFAKRMSRGPAAFATLLIAVICFAAPLTFLGIQFFREAESVYTLLSQPGSIEQGQQALVTLGERLNPTIPGSAEYLTTLSTNLGAYAHQGLNLGFGYAGAVVTGTFSFILQLFVFLMTLYYILKEGPKLKRTIEHFSPLTATETNELFDRLSRTISSVVRGTLLIALIQGALSAVGFALFGVPNGVLWGTVAVFASMIPGIGVAIVFVPAVLFLLFAGHTGAGIGLALFGVLVVGTIDNFLRPFLLSSRSSIHPLLVLLSVLGGVAFFGFAGLFLGPLVISLLLGLLSIYAPSQKDAE